MRSIWADGRLVVFLVASLVATALTAVGPGSTTPVDAGLPSGFNDQLVISAGIEQSTAVIPLDDGRVFVAERNGSVELVDPTVNPVTRSRLINLPDVDTNGEKGLTNMVLDPAFATNGYFYIYYHNTVTDRARLSRFTATGDTASVASEVIIWEDEVPTSNQLISDHWGGGLSFGPDDNLYLVIGDKKDQPNDAQDLTLAAGKVLRLNPAGADLVGPWVRGAHNPHMIPVDNPFIDGPGGNLDEIWALGLRNPFRAEWDLPGNRFFISEVGGNVQSGVNASHEDLHMVTPADAGANFGWPMCEGPDCDGPPPANYSAPVFSIQHPDSRAMMLGPVYRGNAFPNTYFEGVFLFDFVEGWLRYVKVDANGDLDPAVPVGGFPFSGTDDLDKPLAMAEGIDGELWYVGSGELHRIVSTNTNQPPVITEATATPTSSSSAPVTVQFNATASDPDGDPITYLWDFGDGTTSTQEDPSHTYTSTGTFTAVLFVSDATATTVSPEVPIEVGSPPVVTIDDPVDGTTFQAGDVLTIRASATDDGPIDVNDFTWTIGFVHDDHVHPVLSEAPGYACAPTGSSCVDLPVPSDGHDFTGTTSFRIHATVTDADGLTGSDVITAFPEKVDVTIDTDITGGGGTVLIDQVPLTAPVVLDTLIGFEHDVEAADAPVVGGNLWQFDAWSTGETTNEISVVVPSTDATYTAQYSDLGAVPRVTQGLVALYTFDEGTGTTVTDTSGNGTPLNLTIADPANTTWTPGALTINTPTIISSPTAATKINTAIETSNELTIEAWITPTNLTQSGPARITTLSSSSNRRNATLGQGGTGSKPGDRYDIRLRTTNTNNNGTPSTATDPGTATLALTHIVYTRTTTGDVTIYLNGTPTTTDTTTGDTTNWNTTYPLHLANEAGGSRPWLGTLDLIAIYDQALTPTQITQNHTAGPNPGTNPPPVGSPPDAVDDALATDEDTTVVANVLGDNGSGPDTDPDGDPLTVTALDGDSGAVGVPTELASGATVTVQATGAVTYDPGSVFQTLGGGATDTDSFTYTITDGNGGTDTATVTITVNGVNDAPVIAPVADPTVTAEDSLDIPVTVTDPEGDTITITLAPGAPTWATLTDNTNGTATLTLTPPTGTTGTHPATIEATDNGTPNQTTTQPLTITVTEPVGSPPVAVDDAVGTGEDSVLAGDVLASNGNGPDTDPDGDPLTVSAVNGVAGVVGAPVALASGATVTVQATGAFTYDPNNAFQSLGDAATDTDSFTYTITDGNGGTDTATVTITITGANDAPVITPVTNPTVTEDTTTDIPVTVTDPEGDTITITLAPGAPTWATLTDNTNGTATLTLTPPTGTTGTHPATIEATDNGTPNQTTTQPLTITVTEPSARVTQGLVALYTFDEGTGTTVTDTSGNGTPLNLTIADPANTTWTPGALTINTPTIISSPTAATKINTAIETSNELTIEAWITPTNLTQSGPARITTLSSSSNRRNATLGQGGTGSKPGDRYDIRLRTTNTNNNGTPSTATDPGTATLALTHIVYTRTTTGDVTIYLNGTPTTTDTTTGDTTNWNTTYPLHLANEAGGSRPWLGTLDLIAIYDQALTPTQITQNHTAGPNPGTNPPPPVGSPPVAVDDAVGTGEDSVLAGDVLASNGNGPDTDPDGDPLTVSAVNGVAGVVGAPVALASGATVTVQATGAFTYDPNNAFQSLGDAATDTDSFTYTITDGNGGTDTATVTITITGANDAPVITPVTNPTVTEDTTTDIPVTVTDPEGDTITITLAPGAPTWATLTDNTNGTATLTLTPPTGTTGTHPATIEATDNGTPNQTTTQPLTITVTEPSARVTQGLVALYTFDEGTGTTVTDTSGNGTPLNLTIADPANTTWTPGALTINTPTIISSPTAATKINTAIETSNELTIEAWITPTNLTQSGPARITTLSSSSNRRNATLGQGGTGSKPGDRYDIRLRTTNTNNNGTPSTATDPGTATLALTHIVYTRTTTGDVTIYLNGTPTTTDTTTGDTTNWNTTYPLHLANEAGGSRPWLGTLDLIAIYDQALTPTQITQNHTAGPNGG